MTEPYIGQIEIFGFNFPPVNWATAAGQLIAIRQNTTLFALIGTTYGGDGTVTFQLPNLASRQACGSGTGTGGLSPRSLGETFGSQYVTITNDTMPAHTHEMDTCIGSPSFTVEPGSNSCLGAFGSGSGSALIYATPTTPVLTSPQMVQPTGGGQPHNNLQPYPGLNYCIAMQGMFPAFP